MLVFIALLSFHAATAAVMQFYDPVIDHIEVLDVNTFPKEILHSNRMSVVEFYANWCGYSKRFIPHWKHFANETRLWQKTVIRVAAMDCALEINDQICWKNYILEFPQFKFFHARTPNLVGIKKEDENSRSEKFMRATIDFLEKQRHPPKEWPKLFPYISDLESIFETDRDMKYIILIFEPKDSYLGRKLILDFSEYLEHVIIRRVTSDTNANLFKKLQVREDLTEPELFVVTNSHDANKKFEKLGDFMAKMEREKEHNKVDDSILQHDFGLEQKARYDYMMNLFEFIKYNDLEFDFNELDL